MDIKAVLREIKFRCHSCSKTSGCENVALKREEMDRMAPDRNQPQVVTVYCEHCETANEVEVTAENLSKFDISSVARDISRFLR